MKKLGDGEGLEPSADLSWRDVDGELVIVDTRRGDYHVLNTLGARVFTGIVDGEDVTTIVSRIVVTHDAAASEVQRDVDAFLAMLVEKGILSCRQAR